MSTSHRNASPLNIMPSIRMNEEVTIKLTPFDQKEYRKSIEARGNTLRRVAGKLKPALRLSSALDAGCGVGFFSQLLAECGFDVCGFDGRAENVAEACRRYPRIPFAEADIQDRTSAELGKFDLVVCFGLLYHLENPVLAIRNLRELTDKCLLVESICLPGETASMLLRAEPRQDDQSLTDMACYPSESSLVKILYRAGFPAVYQVMPLPDHEDFRDTPNQWRRRTVLLASLEPIDVAGFRLIPEPFETEDPWARKADMRRTFAQRLTGFVASSRRRKYIALASRARRFFPNMPIPLRLPFGAWWLAEKSAMDHELTYGEFEAAELRFAQRLLRAGMTVLDVGAHHGLYTLMASKCVGRSGKVVAFEPSPRECRRLENHLRINRCSNVHLERCAAGSEAGAADLFLADGFQDWCNSLRPPALPDLTQTVPVRVRKIDEVLAEQNIARVDFIKLDVEGGELAALNGATRLLRGAARPAILAEVEDIRTKAWGYPAREIIQFLISKNYRWFAITAKGTLRPIACDQESYNANLVALPVERTKEFLDLLGQK